jgi:hypothetical protein
MLNPHRTKRPSPLILANRYADKSNSGLELHTRSRYKPSFPYKELSMDLIAFGFALIAATAFAQPPMVKPANLVGQSQESRIDGTRVNGVIYFDAPNHSAPNLLRR